MRYAALLLISAASLCAQRPAPIDNDQVRVLVVTDEPHRKGAMHEHKMNRVMIYLDPGENKLEYENGKTDHQKFKAGEVRWSPAGGRHTSENPGAAPFRVVEVELKQPGKPFSAPELDPVKLEPKVYKVLIDNPQVRVLRVNIPARHKIPMHQHALNRVVVYLTANNMRVTDDAGKIVQSPIPAGEVRFAGPAKHMEENLESKPVEVLVVELK